MLFWCSGESQGGSRPSFFICVASMWATGSGEVSRLTVTAILPAAAVKAHLSRSYFTPPPPFNGTDSREWMSWKHHISEQHIERRQRYRYNVILLIVSVFATGFFRGLTNKDFLANKYHTSFRTGSWTDLNNGPLAFTFLMSHPHHHYRPYYYPSKAASVIKHFSFQRLLNPENL